MGPNIKIKHGDFQATLAAQADSSVGLVLTDLPYEVTKKPFDALLTASELAILLRESKRILSEKGALFAFLSSTQIETFSLAAAEAGFRFVRSGVWIKSDSHRHASPYPVGAIEHWIFASSFGDSSNPILPCYVSKHAAPYKSFEKKSDFRKPISLLRTLILNHSNQGELVIDPFGGSGATAIAALLESRSVVVGDIDAQQIDIITTNTANWTAWSSSKPLTGFVRASRYNPKFKSVSVAKVEKSKTRRKRRDPARARWSHDDRKKVLELLYEHSFRGAMSGEQYFTRVAAFCQMGEKLTVTQLRSISYRLIKELGPIPEGPLTVPSFAFDAADAMQRK